ncbi:MAG: bifunctional aspartate kinase/homoserine dehydrogenase I [Chitinophagaceae bacterium]|nr:bifunctional aspartate kinase/homoserine dehydrogenase I [Chitinophagaceae bacterium]
MYVLKFGGSSVANANNIKIVADIVLSYAHKPIVVVVSALSGITDQLLLTGDKAADGDESYKELLSSIEQRHLDTARQLLPVTNQSASLSKVKQYCNEIEDLCEGIFRLQELSDRTKDKLVSFGELLSSQLLTAYLQTNHAQTVWIDSRELIKTDSRYGNAQVLEGITHTLIQARVKNNGADIFVAPGFIASNSHGFTTTLGRGGSDYTAAIFAAALHSSVLEIWTDVSGIMTADPRWVPNARPINRISYQEAMELSHFGAKIIYPPTIQPVMKRNIPVWVKNTFAAQDAGTLIENSEQDSSEKIRGISSINKITLLSLEGSGMVGIPGFSKRFFEALALQQINVILITQSSSEHSICVAVLSSEAEKAKTACDAAFETEIHSGKVDPLVIEDDHAIVALVGDKMKSHPGISGQMFSALGRNGINIRAIAQGSSERNISAVIAASDVKKALNVLHESFFESVKKQLNIFITGCGNVGSKLLGQIATQQVWLEKHLNLQLRVTGLANSRKMVIADDAINLADWKKILDAGETMDLPAFQQKIIDKNLRNSVFVDVTANEIVAGSYEKLLQKSINVVACNKIAASSAYNNYQKLKNLAREFNASFLFETNVGAGLPVISTLNDLVKSGDNVHRIDAVLSGTLNYVFNHYNGQKPFSEVVRDAQNEGYTEPDPRLDLGGTDVMRKILILAREAGYALNMEDIENNGFLPASCFKGTVEDFYAEMAKHEDHFKALYDAAHEQDCKLKFVASFKDGKASVGLQQIPTWHDFYHLYGKDNIVLYYTMRYPEQPLVVKGAGAGADVTASGVFADIIRVASQ